MSSDLAATLTDPAMLVAVLVAIAVFATFYTIAVPFFERGDLNKRMKAVSTERDQIRARERARMNSEVGGEARLRCGARTTAPSARSSSASTFARRWSTRTRSTSCARPVIRSENALNTFLVARFLLPFLFLAVAAFWIFGLGNLADQAASHPPAWR